MRRVQEVRGVVAVSVVVAGIPWLGALAVVTDGGSVSDWAVLSGVMIAGLGILGAVTFVRPSGASFALALLAVSPPVAIYLLHGEILLGLLFAPLPLIVAASLLRIRDPETTDSKNRLIGRRSVAFGLVLSFPGWLISSESIVSGAGRFLGISSDEVGLLTLAISSVLTAGWAIALFVRPTDGMFVASFLVGIVLLVVAESLLFPAVAREDLWVPVLLGLVLAIPATMLGASVPWGTFRRRRAPRD